jgi:FkbM family methyltransferase
LITLSMIVRSGDTFLDIGANVGLFSSVLSRVRNIASDVKFYAFEANPDTAERLDQTLSGTDVTIVNYAISDADGELQFCDGTTSAVFAPVQHATQFNIESGRSVTCKRLDSLDITGNSLILKIDVEGHEMEVIAGAEKFFETNRVKAVFVDGYSDPLVPLHLVERGFKLFDAHTLAIVNENPPHSIVALHRNWLQTNDAQLVWQTS